MAVIFQPPPTYADPVVVDEHSGRSQFNPLWLKWFVDLAQLLTAAGGGGGGAFAHGALTELTLDQHLQYMLVNGTRAFVLGSDANYDLWYRNAGAVARLGVGTNGQVLTVSGGALAWGAASGGVTRGQVLALIFNTPVL